MKFNEEKPLYKLEELAEKLRSKDGCPWDREQDSMSLRKYAIEEAYEVKSAIEKGDDENIKEELGDLLYQVYAHSQIAKEENRFNINDVAEGIISKLIRRHPHVFGNESIETSNDVSNRWEQIKKQEKGSGKSILLDVPKDLPALLKSLRIQEKASRVGFDWHDINDIEAKLDEEVTELKEAIKGQNREEIEEEFGDVLFTLANIGRFMKIDPEEALQATNKKFIKRFTYIEEKATENNKSLEDLTLKEMDDLWNEAKSLKIK